MTNMYINECISVRDAPMVIAYHQARRTLDWHISKKKSEFSNKVIVSTALPKDGAPSIISMSDLCIKIMFGQQKKTTNQECTSGCVPLTNTARLGSLFVGLHISTVIYKVQTLCYL